jgi:hypothetical protein
LSRARADEVALPLATCLAERFGYDGDDARTAPATFLCRVLRTFTSIPRDSSAPSASPGS